MALIESGTPRVSDTNLLKAFIDNTLLQFDSLGITSQAEVSVVIQRTSFTVHLSGSGVDDEYNIYLHEGKIEHEYLNSLRVDNSSTSHITRIIFRDKGTHAHCYFEYSRSSDSLVDKIKTQEQQLNSDSLRLLGHLNGLLTQSPIGDYSNNTDLDIASVHHDVLTRLEGLSANLIEKQNDQLNKIEAEKKVFTDSQLEEFTAKASDLESRYSQKQHQLEESYQSRNDDLDEREKQIEDADNTTARRKTTTATLKEVQEKAKKFNYSTSVSLRSWLAFFFAVLLGLIGGLNAYTATDQLYNSSKIFSELDSILATASVVADEAVTVDKVSNALSVRAAELQKFTWFLYVKAFFSSALLVSSIIYIIKWLNSWADRLAQQELDNQLFVRDLNRAHLAIEMSLEWNEKKDGAIPERLLESLTDNLFQSSDSAPKEILHPAEQLASALVRSADKINVPFAGGDLEVSGKKLGKSKPQV